MMERDRSDRLLNELSKEERLFCCAIADDTSWNAADLPTLLQSVGEDRAWSFAVKNRAESVVALGLRGAFGAKAPSARWSEAIAAVQTRIGLYLSQLDRVAEAFTAENIPVIALKNSGIARGLFPEPAGCPMGDVDVLVDPAQFRAAHSILLRLGYTLDSRSPLEAQGLEEAERDGGAEYTFPLADGSTFWLELQWRPVAGRWIRAEQEPSASELIARSVPITGSAVRLLCPEDNLLQVCLHTAKHSFVRAPGFRLHTDVDRIVRRCPIDWNLFVSRAKALRVCTAVYLSLRIPSELLKTPVPQEVLDALFPGQPKVRLMLRWLQNVGLFDPDKRKWSKPGYIVFNMMLYDDWQGLVRGVFPDATWMRRRYGIQSRPALVWCYARRICNLLLKRARS